MSALQRSTRMNFDDINISQSEDEDDLSDEEAKELNQIERDELENHSNFINDDSEDEDEDEDYQPETQPSTDESSGEEEMFDLE